MAIALQGCTVVQHIESIWPRDHDPVFVNQWVLTQLALNDVNCEAKPTGWSRVRDTSEHMMLLAEFRSDPQKDNIKGLFDHSVKMSGDVSSAFCKLGIKTAQARLNAVKDAWEDR